MYTTSRFRLDKRGSWKLPIYQAVPEAGKMISRKVRNMGWSALRDSITPQGVLAFERDVQKVSRTELAYILPRWGPEFRDFSGRFPKSLECIQIKAEWPRLHFQQTLCVTSFLAAKSNRSSRHKEGARNYRIQKLGTHEVEKASICP